MNYDEFAHDGYMTRLVSLSIFLCTRYTLAERRLALKKLKKRNEREAADLVEVLTIVFKFIKSGKQPNYFYGMWPTVEMVRAEIKPDITGEFSL